VRKVTIVGRRIARWTVGIEITRGRIERYKQQGSCDFVALEFLRAA
jgi:hypothetical protein